MALTQLHRYVWSERFVLVALRHEKHRCTCLSKESAAGPDLKSNVPGRGTYSSAAGVAPQSTVEA